MVSAVKVYRSAAEVGLVPAVDVTVTSTEPEPLGAGASTRVSPSIWKSADMAPNITLVTAPNPCPVMKATVPCGPVVGLTTMTEGATGAA